MVAKSCARHCHTKAANDGSADGWVNVLVSLHDDGLVKVVFQSSNDARNALHKWGRGRDLGVSGWHKAEHREATTRTSCNRSHSSFNFLRELAYTQSQREQQA